MYAIIARLQRRHVSGESANIFLALVAIITILALGACGKPDNVLVTLSEKEAKERGLPGATRADGVKIAIALLSVSKGNEPTDYAQAQEQFRETLNQPPWDRTEVERAATLYVSMMISSLDDVVAFARRRSIGHIGPYQASKRTLRLEHELHSIEGALEMMQSRGSQSVADAGTALANIRIDAAAAERLESAAEISKQTLRQRFAELFGKPFVMADSR